MDVEMTMAFSLNPWNWNGPEFLILYLFAYAAALAWALRSKARANDVFGMNGAEQTTLADPYEMAFLAGGAPRCAQLAVVKFLMSGIVEVKPGGIFTDTRLVVKTSMPMGANDAERALYAAILGTRQKGLPMAEVGRVVGGKWTGVELRLAKLGLRPTTSELQGRGFLIIWPFLLLLPAGGIKLLVGLSRDKPVWFLVIALIGTLITVVVLAHQKRRLTPQGESLLKRMRCEQHAGPAPADAPPETILPAIALSGIMALGHDPRIAMLDHALRKDIATIGNPASSGGDSGVVFGTSGCGSSGSSGCGSSGCGSSGCGGGGCGGD